MTTAALLSSSNKLDLTVCYSFAPIMARFINLNCDLVAIMEDTCTWLGSDERFKQQVKIVIKLFISKNYRATDWVSNDSLVMGFINSALIAILHQMKEDNDAVGEAFYEMLNACENCNGRGEINEGEYLQYVNTTAKMKKIIDYALEVPYVVANGYNKNYEWVLVDGVRHINIHYMKPAAPVLAQ